MKTTRFYRLHCDAWGCRCYTDGRPEETPSRMCVRLTRKSLPDGERWASRMAAQTAFQKEHDIPASGWDVFCPYHRDLATMEDD